MSNKKQAPIRTVNFSESIESKRIDLWCEVYAIVERESRQRRSPPSYYADQAVENFDKAFLDD